MKVVTNKDNLGTVRYNSNIISDIARCAIENIQGVSISLPDTVAGKRCVRLIFDNEMVHVELFVKVNYQVEVNDVASTVQRDVKTAIETNTAFKVSSIDVHIYEIDFNN